MQTVKRNRRLSYQEMELILLKLCEGRWLTRTQLAELLDRNDVALRLRFLTPMVERGLLSLRYPEALRRTDQAYTNSVDSGKVSDNFSNTREV